ncbi:hypothetical protein CANTEDRAFT_115854 [Yamadazyma tenuis ATCC 10573]|uniref:Uncharacterized protein n=1 Tax=Candida tenuis (strain ATCC 10573 / BCRC 21748 / CBS 615 / JCM 9827 / NBRC 10315 / NRRL Y-1498 / VKM Y-70) TaxID=590646 RepID=G3B8H3_CANTC|nr:uncharacterized protein CANTEDRAFT_115854 [Yamadazyma tenuis ATCC 10573]XP_006689066.1 uncharacterized protein CANTEDRAFT_115854 [Yamadazyma tenuis ATCC 10573]EGV62895.1 hypothetical protein CANTEDRAFT_115854 [Yamadazyma tenuis ATCC 10573]EGV62896.1 hypothetical protein CANTEDRAFT_115854 [Yamadazyma tenuis ATCC 10573]
MYHARTVYSRTSTLLLGYLALSTTLPFALSYKESLEKSQFKGVVHPRALFNKI